MNLTDNQAMAISATWACIGLVMGFSIFGYFANASLLLQLLGPTIGIVWCLLAIPVLPRISQTFLRPEYRK